MDKKSSSSPSHTDIRALLHSRHLPRRLSAADDLPEQLAPLIGLMLDANIPTWMCWGEDLQFLYNDAYVDLLGKKHPAALGQPFWTVWPEIKPTFGPIFAQALAGVSAFLEDVELSVQRNNAPEVAWFTFCVTPIRVASERIVGVFCTVNETTQHVLAHRNRLSQAARLRQMFDQAPGFMALVQGPNHVYTIANEAYIRAVGGRQVLNQSVHEALPELAGQGFFELLDQVYATRRPYVAECMPVRLYRTVDGPQEELYINFIYQPIIEPDGSVSGVFIQGSDVTAQFRAQETLRIADQRKDEFLAMLAHELRNPLAPISAAADLLRLPNVDAARVKITSEIITRQVGHLTALVDDLLDVSRVTRGLVLMENDAVDVRQVLADAIEQARPLIAARYHHLATHFHPASASVLGDRKRLVQVVVNLLNNAAKYTPECGSIVLRMDIKDSTVLLSVADTGIGMTEVTVKQVFELFAQAERTPDRSQGGLGIGLALAKSLVDLHGGNIQAHSSGLGKGSTFTVSLPLAPVLTMVAANPVMQWNV